VVQTVFDEEGFLGVLGSLLFLSGILRSSLKTSLLLLLALGAVLVQELEQLCSGVLVERVRELGDCRGDLETLAEDDFLSLKTDIFWPLDEAGQVRFGPNVLADTEILGL